MVEKKQKELLIIIPAYNEEKNIERVLEELSFEASELENKEVTIDGAYVRQKLGEITKDMDTSNYIL